VRLVRIFVNTLLVLGIPVIALIVAAGLFNVVNDATDLTTGSDAACAPPGSGATSWNTVDTGWWPQRVTCRWTLDDPAQTVTTFTESRRGAYVGGPVALAGLASLLFIGRRLARDFNRSLNA
jgi:hypothetical protein